MKLDYLIYLAKSGAGDIHPGGERSTVALLQALDLCPGNHVLEIGCGTGKTLLSILRGYAVTVIGLDLLPHMLATARRRLQFAGKSRQDNLLQSNAVHLPFPDCSFERVYSESVLGFQDVASVVAMLEEIKRVLTPAGLYVANEAIWKPRLDEQVVAEINRTGESDFGLRQSTDQPWSLADWLEAAQAAGFRLRSADLLEIHLKGVVDSRQQSGMRVSLSDRLFTWTYGLRSLFDRSSLRQHLHYRRLLRAHRQDGSFLEERLFIFEKP